MKIPMQHSSPSEPHEDRLSKGDTQHKYHLFLFHKFQRVSGVIAIFLLCYNCKLHGTQAPQIQKLFTKFTRVMEGTSNLTTVGFGLGLYVARLIVDEHKGRIWAESAGLGKGSAFMMEVPLVTDRLE